SNGTTTLTRPWSFPDGLSLSMTSATLVVPGATPLRLSDLSLTSSSVLTTTIATSSSTSMLDIRVTGSVAIDSGSRIDVSGKGYLGAFNGDNASTHGRTKGNVPTAGTTQLLGGSYGGYGYSNGATPTPLYGDLKDPLDLGTGGDGPAANSPGGNG